MFSVATDWNPKQQKLRQALTNKGDIKEAIRLCFDLHSIVHSAVVYSETSPSLFDEIYNDLSCEVFRMPLSKGNGFERKATIAWDIWHITRIEDITVNILIADEMQVLDEAWLKRLGITVKETGNAMCDEEILHFSRTLNPEVLREYRNAVGMRTREILNRLTPQDIKRKFGPNSIARILSEGGVTEDKKSIWLLDFWGKKNVAGILLMPVTRHQIVHLNECVRIKASYQRK